MRETKPVIINKFSMAPKINLCAVLLFLLLVSNPGQLAPVPGKLDTSGSDESTTLTENDLLEGDMIIDETVLNIISNQTAGTKRSAVTNGVKLWPNGVVPYVISNRLSSFAQSIIHQAIATLHASTCVRFTPRTNQYHYVQFIYGNGCYSYVGKHYPGQAISLGYRCESVGIALHEMVHTLGFFHTSSRTDRDAYVTIYNENIAPGMARNFQKYYHGQIDHLNSPYDITSIMHLPRKAFSKSPNLNTIEARAGAHIKLGETGRLSPVDKYQINALYKCSLPSTQGSCLTTLGLENHAIPDSALRASSQDSSLYAASAGRLHQSSSKFTQGAWCPKTNNYSNSWLEIDLGRLVKITAIATQGYEGLMYNEYIPKYNLKYKTSPYSNRWYSYVSSCRAYAGAKGLPGNWDGRSVQYNALTPSLTTRYVRLYPKSWKHRPCLRVELYGCKI